MDDDEELSIGEFKHRLGDIVERVPNPEGARQLLETIASRLARRKAHNWDLSEPMWEYLTLALSRYLAGECSTLDKAFGVAKPRKRPTIMTERDIRIAADVMTLMKRGRTLAAAAEELEPVHNLTAKKIEAIYAKNKDPAGLAYATAEILAGLEKEAGRPPEKTQVVRQRGGAKIKVSPR